MINSIKPIRLCCEKVLPLVYDNSLSYYEILCKVVNQINKLMENDIILKNSIEELQNYLNTNIENIVNQILTEMIKDGSFVEIIKNLLNDEFYLASNLYTYNDPIDNNDVDLYHMSSETFYQLFDNEALKLGFTKNIIGYATLEGGGADRNNPIYSYDRNRYTTTHATYNGSYRRILITSCIHGNEKNGAWAVYRLLKIANTNPFVKSALNYNEFTIIPICNPYGFNEMLKYSAEEAYNNNIGRTNANGVNIARNFNTFWNTYTATEPSENKGSSPLSEEETKAIYDTITISKYDYYIDVHGTNPINNDLMSLYLIMENVKISKNVLSIFESCINNWDFINISNVMNTGSFSRTTDNIPCAINDAMFFSKTCENTHQFELPKFIFNEEKNEYNYFSKETLKMGVDVLITWLLRKFMEQKQIVRSFNYKNKDNFLQRALLPNGYNERLYEYGRWSGGEYTERKNSIISNFFNVTHNTLYHVLVDLTDSLRVVELGCSLVYFNSNDEYVGISRENTDNSSTICRYAFTVPNNENIVKARLQLKFTNNANIRSEWIGNEIKTLITN